MDDEASPQSGCERHGCIDGNTGQKRCIIHWETDSFPYRSVCLCFSGKNIYIHAGVIHRLISPDINETVNIHFSQLDLHFCLIYERAGQAKGRNSFRQHQMSVYLSDIPELLHLLSLPVWMDRSTLLICSVLVLWFWNRTQPLNVWWLSVPLGLAWYMDFLWVFLTSVS